MFGAELGGALRLSAGAPEGGTARFDRSALRFRTLLLAVALLSYGCGDDDPVGDVASISGTVRDEASGDRLKGAKVVFTADTLESYEGRTNGDGEFAITIEARAPNGRLEASKSGYETKTVSVYLDDTTVQIDVGLPARPAPPESPAD
jgi:hypothetical protein